MKLQNCIGLGASLSFFLLLLSACTGGGKVIREYACLIEPLIQEAVSWEGETVSLRLRITNTGRENLMSFGPNPCFLSYHLLDEKGTMLKFDNPRISFPQKVRPRRTVEIEAAVRSPLEPGSYLLEFDIVRERIAWFKDYGRKTPRISLRVEKKAWSEDETALGLDYGKYTKFRAGIPEFNTLHKLIRITLGHDEVEFQGITGQISGFYAGSGYPQIWLRDAATILPASRLFYPETFQTSWLEEHLAVQRPDGSLEDWIDSAGKSDKNTTETDQETSAIQAAYEVFRLLGPDRLEKTIQGEPIIRRLEKALMFVWEKKRDRKTGLVIGAHTADWGDVEMEDADQQAIYAGPTTHWTADIYDQSMFFQACLNLAEMLGARDPGKRTTSWKEKAEFIRKNADKHLWQEDRGFYRVHLHLDALTHDFDEDDMFAMGGNVQAVLSGLADRSKSGRIIEQALRRKKEFNISTISGVLLPPYPRGFFKHPMVNDPYEYQNGGQWDWFGGRLVWAMFENGFSRSAREELLEIARKNINNGSFYEWDTPEGSGRGSDYYAGSAGMMAKALFEGYFGVKVGKESLSLEPKLDRDEALIHLYIPAADIFVAYEYRFSAEENMARFAFNSNHPRRGRIRLLNPWSSPELNRGHEMQEGELEVALDGRKIPYRTETLNHDEFIVIDTDFKNHLLEIRRTTRSTAE